MAFSRLSEYTDYHTTEISECEGQRKRRDGRPVVGPG